MSELKPCPLCGGKAGIIKHRYQGTGASGMETPEPSIKCTVCKLETRQYRADDWPSGRKAGTPTYQQAEAQLITDWNTRTPPTNTEAEGLAEYSIEGSIYEGMEAAIVRDGRTVAHCRHYGEAVALLAADPYEGNPAREGMIYNPYWATPPEVEVERVASAIYEEDRITVTAYPFEELRPFDQDRYRRYARAALTAMKGAAHD